jgi:hypothetical protein
MAKTHRSLSIRAKALLINILSSRGIRTTATNLGPLLRGKISAFPPKYEINGVPSMMLRRLYLLFYIRGMVGSNQIFVRQVSKLAATLHERVAAANPDRGIEPLPVVHWDNLVEDEFCREFYWKYHPIVIKGWPLDVDDWNLAWFIARYGDCKVLFTELESGKNFVGPLSLLKTQRTLPICIIAPRSFSRTSISWMT